MKARLHPITFDRSGRFDHAAFRSPDLRRRCEWQYCHEDEFAPSLDTHQTVGRMVKANHPPKVTTTIKDRPL